MLLLVGLGNPGPRYEKNRHNIGFMAVDEIVRRHSFGPWRARFQAHAAEGVLGDEKVLAMKPSTFMNDSGRAVGEAARFFRLTAGEAVVLHDELDLAFGKVRVKSGGGHAGHNGLRSVDAHLGPDFHRVRIGIGHPGDKERVHGHVLSDFAKAEEPMVAKLVDAIADAAPMLADPARHNAFMTRVSFLLNPPPPKPAKPEKEATPKDAPEGGDGI